jgi:DNA-binding IclR family transcriptional regulator
MTTVSASPDHAGSRSLVYGLSLLRLFTSEQPVRGISELADQLELSRPTAHRFASTCLELGYLEQTPRRRYRLTRRAAQPGIALLGSLALAREATPILRELRRQTGRTVSLALLEDTDVLYVARLRGFLRGQYQLEHGLGAGSRRPAHESAAGKALLNAARTRRDDRLGPNHESALSVDGGGLRSDARGLAIAVPSESEHTSAIELTVPAAELSTRELIAELGEPLRAAGEALQARLLEDRESICA